MFTGIVEGNGEILQIDGNRYQFSHPFEEKFQIGESVAVSGMCVTVVDSTDKTFDAEIIAESRNRTIFSSIQTGDQVNLERSAIIGQRNSGHNVTGHIDQTGEIVILKKQDDFYLLRISINPENKNLIVEKGSVAVDGISLTISAVSDDWFEVSIIPHTWDVTTLKHRKEGNQVNIEFDILGKYLNR